MTPEPFAWCKVNTSIFSLFPLLKFSVKPRQGWNPLYTEKQLRASYAAGAKDMQERCAKLVDTHEWVGDAVYDIKALETT